MKKFISGGGRSTLNYIEKTKTSGADNTNIRFSTNIATASFNNMSDQYFTPVIIPTTAKKKEGAVSLTKNVVDVIVNKSPGYRFVQEPRGEFDISEIEAGFGFTMAEQLNTGFQEMTEQEYLELMQHDIETLIHSDRSKKIGQSVETETLASSNNDTFEYLEDGSSQTESVSDFYGIEWKQQYEEVLVNDSINDLDIEFSAVLFPNRNQNIENTYLPPQLLDGEELFIE